jgi:hypothetical protein
MSARTEQLIEEIASIEQKIAQQPDGSRAIVMLREQLMLRQRELTAASEALTEGKQILKG